MTAINQFPITGYATHSGTHLNKIVTALNNITGNGTPQPATVTTLNASGLITATSGVAGAVNGTLGAGTPAAATVTTLGANSTATLTNGLTRGGAQISTVSFVAAAGATQGNATAIAAGQSTVVVTVTASTEGVKLPTAATGKRVDIFADPSVGAKVYAAAAGQKIGTATTATTAFALAKNTATVFLAKNTTQWLVLKGV